jgi:hypothetical protein
MKHAVTDRSAHRGVSRSILVALLTMAVGPACGAGGNIAGPDPERTSASLTVAGSDVCETAGEGAPLALACPEGSVITAVSFASYGTPGGACGAFAPAQGCNAQGAATILSTACMGKSNCTVDANNETFGDPCVGTVKRLSAQVSCGQAPAAAAAPTPVPTPMLAAAVAGPAGAVATPVATTAPKVSGPMKIGTNFWNLGWGIWDDVFAAGAAFATGTTPWRPEFLQEVAPYAALRFMDFGETNGSSQVTWADRTQPTAPASAQTKLAYEWMIDLCNRLGRDMWVTVPHRADEAYGLALADLIQRSLDPKLKVYVEWSNETWNGGFPQTQYSYDQGNALGLSSDPWTAAFKYHVYAAVRLFHSFDTVFGANSPRVVKVLAGQSPNSWITEQHLAALADPKINPLGVKVDAYAIAPYFGHDVDGAAGDAVTRLHQAVQQAIGEVKKQYEVVHAAGLPLLAYEGGQHVLNNAQVVNQRPEMYDIYKEYLDGVAPYFALFMHYVHNGNWNPGGAWGAEKFVGEPLSESPKLRSLFDWIKSH